MTIYIYIYKHTYRIYICLWMTIYIYIYIIYIEQRSSGTINSNKKLRDTNQELNKIKQKLSRVYIHAYICTHIHIHTKKNTYLLI